MRHEKKKKGSKESTLVKPDRDAIETPSSQNNIGTVGYISYKKPEGKGSFKKITERVNKKPFNEHGEGENEERHNLW